MGLFGKNKSISRLDLKSKFRRDRGVIKGGEGKYSYAERDKLARETFGHKYGSEISRDDYKRAIRGLEREKNRTGYAHREKIDDKIKYLKQMGEN